MSRFVGALALLPVLGVLTAQAQPAVAVGMVTDLSGKATDRLNAPVHLLDEVFPGQWIRLEKEAKLVVVQLSSGDELVFHGPSRFRFGASGKVEGTRPSEVRKHPSLGALRLRAGGMAQAALVMRSGSRDLRMEVLPKGPVILDPVPRFRWEPLGPGAQYRFKLFDAKGKTFLDETVSAPFVKVPGDRPLKEEEDYTWILEATLPDQAPRISTSRIRLLDAQRREQMVKARPGAAAPFTERLVYAALLEGLQVWDDARVAWQTLARERPTDGRLKVLASR